MLNIKFKNHVASIGQAFRKFVETKENRFNHLQDASEGVVIVNLFTYFVTPELRGGFIGVEKEESWEYYHVFPIGKIVASGDDRYKAGDLIGIDPMLCQIVESPVWNELKYRLNEKPEVPEPDVPRYLRNYDLVLNSSKFIDMFVPEEKTDTMFMMMGHNIKIKYSKGTDFVQKFQKVIKDGEI